MEHLALGYILAECDISEVINEVDPKCIIIDRTNKSEAPIVTSTMARFSIPVCRQKKIISI